MSLPTRPIPWANRLTKVLETAFGADRFPVDVELLALQYTRQMFHDPITKVIGEPLAGFEGGLFPSPSGKPRWLIAYNSALRSGGRIRFTQAHELGHYLLHRRPSQSNRCRPGDMLIWDPTYQRREAEANRFASYLLMPIDDYREQVTGEPICLELFSHCAERYDVSLTAAILKWLEFTPEPAVLVCSRDGLIDWAVPSRPALRRGAFFKTRDQPPIPVPEGSLARQGPGPAQPNRCDHAAGVWFQEHPVSEFALVSERYDLTLSLLLLKEGEA